MANHTNFQAFHQDGITWGIRFVGSAGGFQALAAGLRLPVFVKGKLMGRRSMQAIIAWLSGKRQLACFHETISSSEYLYRCSQVAEDGQDAC